MTKNKPLVIPKPKCHVESCTEDAAYGFREIIDTTNNDSAGRAKEFIMGATPNWCLTHDLEMRKKYAGVNGDWVDLRKA
jgi:hypothetical protein